jgi:hypothetical protein
VKAWEAVRWVRDGSQLKGNARLVAYALASRLNNEGECWPTFEQLAQDTGLSKRSVAARW